MAFILSVAKSVPKLIQHFSTIAMTTFATPASFLRYGVITIDPTQLDPSQQDCPICLEPYLAEHEPEFPQCVLRCLHVFGNRCLIAHVTGKRPGSQDITCPMCRAVLAKPLVIDIKALVAAYSTHQVYFTELRVYKNMYEKEKFEQIQQIHRDPKVHIVRVLMANQRIARIVRQLRDSRQTLTLQRRDISDWARHSGPAHVRALRRAVLVWTLRVSRTSTFLEAWETSYAAQSS